MSEKTEEELMIEQAADKFARTIPGLPRHEGDYRAYLAGAHYGYEVGVTRAAKDFTKWLEIGASAWREWTPTPQGQE
jgi:hypothetical protein